MAAGNTKASKAPKTTKPSNGGPTQDRKDHARAVFNRTETTDAEKWLAGKLDAAGKVDTATLRILAYGRPGVGKTRFCATLPQPILFLNCEQPGAVLSILQDTPNIHVLNVDKHTEIPLALKVLEQSEDHPFKSLVIDGLNEWQKRQMDAILDEGGREIPAIQDWQRSGRELEWMIRKAVSLNLNVAVTCAAQEMKDEEEGGIRMRLDLPGKLAGTLHHHFDVYGYMSVSAGEGDLLEHRVRIQPHAKIDAKIRIPPGREHLFETYIDPDFGLMHHLMFGELDAEGAVSEYDAMASELNLDPKKADEEVAE